jgi:23S rRNA (guanosine2251-2'-O)-methyltransferase
MKQQKTNKHRPAGKDNTFSSKKKPKTAPRSEARPFDREKPAKGAPARGRRFSPRDDEFSVPRRVNSRGEALPPRDTEKSTRPGRPKSAFKETPSFKKEDGRSPRRPSSAPFSKGSGPRKEERGKREGFPERKITYGKKVREISQERPEKKIAAPVSDDISGEDQANNYIYGRHPVIEALKNGTSVNKVWIGEYTRDTSEIVELLKDRGIPYIIAPRNKLNSLVGDKTNHQGVVAEIAGKEYTEFDDLVELCKVKSPFFIILDKVEDPHNLGAIIRTADAAGVDAIIIPRQKAVGLTGAVAKTSAGALERMKVCRVANLGQALDVLKENNVWSVAVDMDGQENYAKADYKGAIALVLGGEGKGLSRLLKEKCDFLVKIPMKSQANSLNVSVATAIMIYEVYRQKNFKLE